MNDKNCTYCKLISGKITADIPTIYEDELVFAFLSHVPVNPGHAIVIPKEHYMNPSALPELVAGRIFYIASRIGVACRRALEADGYNIIANDGFCSGQDILHAHSHIIPRYINDGFHLNWRMLASFPSLIETAEKIKAKLKK
jgi:histidine triad (HIT) family protein